MRAWGVAMAVMLAAGAAQAAAPSLESVTPQRIRDVLGATVRTSEFPGSRFEQSVASGMPSMIEMRLTALDPKNKTVAEQRLFWRIRWDLWDEVLRIEGPRGLERFDDLASLDDALAVLRDLPVAQIASLDANARHRLRAECRLHPVAPRETRRLSRWVSGEEEPAGRGGEGREVSIGLSQVIRFFYEGAARDPDVLDQRFSAWFVPAELPEDAPPPATQPEAPEPEK